MPPAPTESSDHLKVGRKPIKKSNFACENCRVRKRRCDGGQPRCRLCSQSDNECIYKRLPSRKYIEDLEQQCEELQGFVDRLRSANQEERLRLLSALDPKTESGLDDERHTPGASSSKSLDVEDPTDLLAGDFAERAKISSDGENRLSLHGPSSLFYLTPLKDEPIHNDDTETTFTQALDLEHRLLVEWLDTMTSQTDLPVLNNEIWTYMLRMHFVWIQPLFGFVHRPAFLRDMHLSRGSKSMFSPFLIYSLSAHVVRYQDLVLLAGKDKPVEDPFLRHARLLVFPEVEKGSKLSSIHGLLLLAAKECSLGRVGQAWIYLGIAVRMVQDLGIHLDGRESEDRSKFDADELNNRQYSFWSAFTWDKMISMYCGRVPMLQLSKYSPSQNFDDAEAENEMWQPVGNGLDGFPYFEPTPAYGVSSFSQLCGLARVINSILLYDAGEINAPKLDDIRKQLAEWRAGMPAYLRLDAAKGFAKIPPAHIINVNCLYHMISCLVDRRIQPGAPRASAVTSAMEISVLAQLSHKHFRDRQAVLSHCYCIYIAATVFLYRLRYRRSTLWLTEEETIVYNSLQWCLGRLRDVAITIQALKIPVKVLHEHLQSIQGSFQVPTAAQTTAWTATEPLPTAVLPSMTSPTIPRSSWPDPNSAQSSPVVQQDDLQQAPAQHMDPGLVFTQEFWNWLGGGELGMMPPENPQEV